MTTTQQGVRGRLARRFPRLARIGTKVMPPSPAPESTLDAEAGIRRTRVATYAFAVLALTAGAFRAHVLYAALLLFTVLANGRNDWYRGWIKGYEARRQEHLRQLNG